MPTPLDQQRLLGDLRQILSSGPTTAREAILRLGISQPAFSRLIRRSAPDILVAGRARATRYALYRDVLDVGRTIPLYEVDESGRSRRLALLHATRPDGLYVEAHGEDCESAFFEDLPYYLDELRPNGFLGRLLPRRHPELGAPGDIQLWTANHALAYAVRYGWNLPGNLIAGDEAFRLYVANTHAPPDLVPADRRADIYPRLADDILHAGAPGSSAAGEQPKFLVSRGPEPTPVLVKFSPPATDAIGRRLADLLIAEHLAHDILRLHRHEAAQSEIVTAEDRVFLEVVRFDRLPGGGRRGLLSLFALDAEFVGQLRTWSETAAELHRQGRIDAGTRAEIRWRELFGRLIANTDMHAGNLSFFMRGTTLARLAPVYDMLPMLFAPHHGHLPRSAFTVPIPDPADAPIWAEACTAAADFWRAVAEHPLVSEEFRTTAALNASLVESARTLGRLLPGAGGAGA